MNYDEIKDNDLSQAIDDYSISFKERISYDKLTFYYLSLPVMLFGNMIGAILLSAIQLNVVDMYSIGIWLLISVVMFAYGLYHYTLFKNETEANKLKNADIWFDKYYTNTLINGIVWGSSAFLLFPSSSLLNQMIVLFFLLAIGFMAMGILASKIDLLLTYILVTYSPIILRLFFMESDIYTTIAYAIFALILIMILIANYYGKIINTALYNRQDFITIKHTHEKLKERFFSLFERAPVGIYYYNDKLELEDINAHFIEMNKLNEKNDLVGKNLHYVSNAQVIEAHQNVFQGLTGNYRGPFKSLSNENLFVQLSTVPMMDMDGKVAGGITIINDITNEITAKEKMVRNAYYDLLTDIPNRTLLMDKLKEFISNIKEDEAYAVLCVLDIDNFKKVNETFGHDVGDGLLKQAAKRIEDAIDSHETFARISGNKFVILIPVLDKDKTVSEEKTLAYVDALRKHFVKPLSLIGGEYHLTFTTGMILFRDPDASAYDLLKKAEIAMYKAKNNARGTNQFYEVSMSADAEEQLMIENDIHKAMQKDEFSIYYQPQLNVDNNHIVGAEALIRWDHPVHGFISPTKFIPVAEESGIIIKLEEWIFERTIRDIQTISERPQGFTLDHIAINVSTVHFLQPYFVEKLMLLVQKYKVNPQWIELEITESGVMRNVSDAIEKIKMLKNFGFTFSIDDFGTGYSSLSYLKELPIDTLKIDQSFLLNMDTDKGNALIAESIVTIGQKFNLKVLAEGVESEEVLQYLKNIKCDIYQGYLLHKAMTLEKFLAII